MRLSKPQALPDAPESRLDELVDTAKAQMRAMWQHLCRLPKQQFGNQKTRLRGMLKNRCNVSVFSAMTNIFLALRQLLATLGAGIRCVQMGQFTHSELREQRRCSL